EITLTGNDLDEPQKLLFNHPGIKADLAADPTKPVKPPQGNQPVLMTAKFKVAIAADVPVGSYDVRFVSKAGVSNPRAFVVGDLLDCTLPGDGDYLVRVCSFAYLQGTAEHFYRLTVSTAPWIDAVFPPVVEPGRSATLTVHGRNLPGGKPDPAAVVDGRVLE